MKGGAVSAVPPLNLHGCAIRTTRRNKDSNNTNESGNEQVSKIANINENRKWNNHGDGELWFDLGSEGPYAAAYSSSSSIETS